MGARARSIEATSGRPPGPVGPRSDRWSVGLWLVVIVATAWLAGCAAQGGAVAAQIESDAMLIDPGASSVESDIGGMDEFAVSEQFNELSGELARCVEQGSAELDVLGGRVQVAMRVRRDGRTRWAYLKDSTLGDRRTEKCILALVQRQQWPQPLSGEGLADTSFEVDPRAPTQELDPRRVGGVVPARSHARRCRQGIRGTFRATVYLTSRGRVMSAGVAPPNEAGEEVADCIVAALESQRFRFSGSQPAKVSFEL